MKGNTPGLYKQSVVSRQLQQEEDYWTAKLTGQIIKSVFPYNGGNNRKSQELETGVLEFKLTGNLYAGLMKLCNGSDYRLHMILVAGLAILLNKYTANTDIIVGTPILKQDIEAEFINTALALRNSLADRDMTFKELLLQVRQTITEANENQNYPIEQLPRRLGMSFSPGNQFPLFDLAVILENIQERKYIRHIHLNMTFSFLRTGEAVEGRVEFNSLLYDKKSIGTITSHFIHLLTGVLSNINIKIRDIVILTPGEKNQLLFDFNNTGVDYPDEKTIHRLFFEQVEKTPDAVALVLEDKKMTYNVLNKRASQSAEALRDRGGEPGTITAIMLPGSIELIIAILAVLNSGSAYLPIDPTYPGERIKYMLEDAKIRFLVTKEEIINEYSLDKHIDIDVCLIDDPVVFPSSPGAFIAGPGGAVSHLKPSPVPVFGPAYIIYTSGSTGRPRGVIVEHTHAVNTLLYRKEEYKMNGHDVSLQLFSHAFDGFITSFFTPIISGARVILLNSEQVSDVTKIKGVIVKNRVTRFICVPTLYRALLECISPLETASLKTVTLAGEALSIDILEAARAKNKNIEIVNEYGVTEAAVLSTLFRHQEKVNLLSIGKPTWNTKIFIISEGNQLQPVGLPGELCISGAGVARGYLNRPELTAEKFMVNLSWCCDAAVNRLYRTGDLGRWTTDGNIRFLGRIDHQVKIRGFRIELGEIESKLSCHKQIKEAVVTLKENTNEDRYLCAYIVGNNGMAPAGMTNGKELREYLSKELPEYMIPLYYVKLEKMPLNTNGKIDRNALPEPGETGLDNNESYIPPRNPIEKELVKVWENVLGRKNIGINDNFFMIGGDSIKSIRILSGMNKAGYKIEMKELFQHPTISALAAKVKKLERIPDQSPVTGIIPLTPIQEWFFQGNTIDPHHFNQAVMFYSKEGFAEEEIKAVFMKIQEHHDALRMTFKNKSGKIVQTNHGLSYPFSLQVYDFRNPGYAVPGEALEAKVNEIQAGIDPGHGPLMKLGLFHLEDGDRLLIVIHHLVIDGVSWRILFEDIENLIRQYRNGEQLVLPLKTDPFMAWAEELSRYADSPAFLKELPYWEELETVFADTIETIETDFQVENNSRKDTDTLSFSLTGEETELLLTGVNHAFGTEMNDLLLTALGLGIKRTWGHNQVLIQLEGHGREDIIENMEISRTLGWFTSAYPVLLDVSYENDMGRQLKEIKETLRRVPNKGVGYGILKYLTGEHHKQGIEFKLAPQVGFNYLGQFDADMEQMSFEIANESAGHLQSLNGQRECEFDVSGVTANNRLVMTIVYNKNRYEYETVKTLADNFHVRLRDIIAYCSARKAREFTPHDFTYKGLSIDAVDRLNRQYNPEDIYTLTPMQEGMLFHTLYDDSSASYFEQTSYRLHGELDINIVEKSFNQLIKRRDILRTVFVHEGFDRPVQVVLKNRLVDFYYKDISGMVGVKARELFIEEFKARDKQRNFDLSKDVLMRVSVFQVGCCEYEIIWSFFHILMDGWCIGILNSEFFEIYNSLLQNRPMQLPGIKPYRNYIQWLERQDKEASERYWRTYLDSYREAAVIPKIRIGQVGKSIGEKKYKNEHFSIRMDREITARLSRIAARNHVTMNIIMQALWGIILGKYNGKRDVVFGAVVSGRPFDLEGVETMVGLFINTIPVRIRFGEKTTFSQLLQRVQQEAIESEPYHYHPLAEIQSESVLKQDLLDHLFIFENYPAVEQIEGYENKRDKSNDGVKIELSNVEVFEQTNYNFNVVFGYGDELSVKFAYNGNTYDRDFVERIGNQFRQVFTQIIDNEELEIGGITFLTGEEENRVLFEFNRTGADYPRDETIPGIFAGQVGKNSDSIAVVGMSSGSYNFLTYRELDCRSERLSRLLVGRGVGVGSIIGLIVKRSLEMIIGILGILKAGGAYLPIDPDYPQERMAYMLKDSDVRFIVVSTDTADKVNFNENVNVRLINLSTEIDSAVSNPFSESVSSPGLLPGGLAYILYTSGTSGRPKGVMVNHRNVLRLVKGTNYINLSVGDRLLLTGAMVFDITTFEIWGVLLNGLSLYLVDQEIILDVEKLKVILLENRINILHLVPQLFNQLATQDPEIFSRLKYFLVGGDRVGPENINKIRQAYPGLTILHMYGPTENTTFSTYFRVDRKYKTKIPIGKPISNSSAYVMDLENRDNFQPVGITGELVVGGEGAAIGYLNNPELTSEKFLIPGIAWKQHNKKFLRGSRGQFLQKEPPGWGRQKIYKTGDLARWLPDGTLEFLGRRDQQVKIRGIRIEPGEIEQQLMSHEYIEEAVVIVNEEVDLCAYFTTGTPVEAGEVEELSRAKLREFLLKRLPGYMVPRYFVYLDRFTLTSTGKIDRGALPKPGEIETVSGETYSGPANEIERALVEVWAEVLGREKIGVTEDFFMIGGDSIKAIQIVSRMRKRGYKVSIQDIFQHRTAGELATVVTKTVRESDQSVITGLIPLTPIQREFFRNCRSYGHHFNQAVMLEFDKKLDKEVIRRVFLKIQQHHDVLRMTYREGAGEIIQTCHGLDYPFSLREYDLRESGDGMEVLATVCNEIQASIDLGSGPVMKLGLFHFDEGDRLLIVVHHLVIDGVSWRILLEDIESLYRHFLEFGDLESAVLQLKSDSFRYWSERLQDYSRGKELLGSLEYWREVESTPVLALPVDYEVESARLKIRYGDRVSIEFSEADTVKLLEEVHRAYNTEINDILLAALALAVNAWTGHENILISLEGHGREEIIEGMDISRTVGWFTTRFPVILRVLGSQEKSNPGFLSAVIKKNKERLRAIPDRGIGYGILRWLTPLTEREGLEFCLEPEIGFNYLGQWNGPGGSRENRVFGMSSGGIGDPVSPETDINFKININGMITSNRLGLSFDYNRYQYDRATIEALAGFYRGYLLQIIRHCTGKQEMEKTPSDFSTAGLDEERLESVYDALQDIFDD